MKLLFEHWRKHLKEERKDSKRVSKVVIQADNGDVLLIKRADGEKKWDLPGGHALERESHNSAAERETEEETNIDLDDLTRLSDKENIRFFKASHTKDDIKLDPNEHTEYEWVNPKDIGNYDMRQDLKDVISKATDPVTEDFQQDVKKNYSKYKIKLIGSGPNRYNVGGEMKKPSYKRAKSAPPGFGGSLEE